MNYLGRYYVVFNKLFFLRLGRKIVITRAVNLTLLNKLFLLREAMGVKYILRYHFSLQKRQRPLL
jgi:hypothetical protein